jgi:ribonuclease HI
MAEEALREFTERREQGNRAILGEGNLSLRRFFALDHDVYSDGVLPRKEKELQGLVASAVLRCDDCVSYHLVQAKASGASRAEVVESLAVALIAGGSIVIPHLRHAFAALDELWGSAERDGEEDTSERGKA